MVGRVPGSPRTPGSGRKRGSLDREQRKVLTDKMAGDIMRVYTRLGGVAWLLKFAEENPAEFLRQGLSRLFPQPIKEDPDVLVQQQFNLEGNPTEVARRIAFALSLGLQGQQEQVTADRVPYSRLAQEPTPQEACHIAPDPERERWAQEVALTPEERLAAEDIDAHTNRKAFATPRPSWMDAEKPVGRPRVGVPRSRRDLL